MFSTLSTLSSHGLRSVASDVLPLYFYSFNTGTTSGTTINTATTSVNTHPLTASNVATIISTGPTPKEGDRCFTSGNKLYNAMSTTHSISTANGISVSFWYNILAAGTLNQICLGLGIGTTSKMYVFFNGARDTVLVNTLGANNILTVQSANMTNGVWNHLAITWKASTITLYLNGVAKTWSTSVPTALPSETWTSMALGKSVDNVLQGYSAMDMVRVYSSVLTAAQINTLYTTGL